MTTVTTSTEGHYCKEFIIKCNPFFVQGFNSIYKTTVKKCTKRKYLLKEFQEALESIPLWNSKIIENEYARFKNASNCEWLENLIKAAFVELSDSLTNGEKNIVDQIPKGELFVHSCYINIAREVWRKPQLFYHDFSNLEKKQNEDEIHAIIHKAITDTIRNSLPLQDIVDDFLHIKDTTSINNTTSSTTVSTPDSSNNIDITTDNVTITTESNPEETVVTCGGSDDEEKDNIIEYEEMDDIMPERKTIIYDKKTNTDDAPEEPVVASGDDDDEVISTVEEEVVEDDEKEEDDEQIYLDHSGELTTTTISNNDDVDKDDENDLEPVLEDALIESKDRVRRLAEIINDDDVYEAGEEDNECMNVSKSEEGKNQDEEITTDERSLVQGGGEKQVQCNEKQETTDEEHETVAEDITTTETAIESDNHTTTIIDNGGDDGDVTDEDEFNIVIPSNEYSDNDEKIQLSESKEMRRERNIEKIRNILGSKVNYMDFKNKENRKRLRRSLLLKKQYV